MRAHQASPTAMRAGMDKRDDVAQWRLDCLLGAGFAAPLALRLATTPGVDLHAMLDLVDRGCPPDLAARILGP
jgi:hypothetical protein